VEKADTSAEKKTPQNPVNAGERRGLKNHGRQRVVCPAGEGGTKGKLGKTRGAFFRSGEQVDWAAH